MNSKTILILYTVYHISLTTEVISGVTQVTSEKDGVLPLNESYVETWQNRRLHTVDIWINKKNFNEADTANKELAPNKWYTVKFYMSKEELDRSRENDEKLQISFSWNLHSTMRSAFTYMNFLNEPLGPETVRYEITTNMFDLTNATIYPVNTSVDYTKVCLRFNATHIMMWTNNVFTLKLFLRDIPLDLGNTKYFKFANFTAGSDDQHPDLYKIYYWDPTVFCWDGCYDDELPEKFHFDRSVWTAGGYGTQQLGNTCKIVNCTEEVNPDNRSDVNFPRSEFPRCVRLYHTPQGADGHKISLKCTNENYTYTACEAFPDHPCWYEVCDNYDLCNAALSIAPFFPLLPVLITLLSA